jgi:hypothetical protein
MFPGLSLLGTEEPHLGRFSLQASAFFYGLYVSIHLHFIQGFLLVFAVPLLEMSFVPMLRTLDVVAEAAVEQGTMYFKQG